MVVREFEDPGYSGKFLERPDLDELRDLVAAGGLDVVVASKRDRLASGLYAGYLKNEFKRRRVELVALDSVTEDTPYGELLENTLDNFSEFERFMIADRMRRGKRSKAKKGKLVAGPQSDYGFRYDAARDGYEVDEVRMAVVRRIFRMVGVEGMTLNAIAHRLEAEGIPSPRGNRFWNRPGLRKIVLNDVYLARTHEEVARIVTPEVAAALDPERRYGISWYGKQRHTHSREVRMKDGKKTYPKAKKSVDVPREEWIGVPVPDSGIPGEWVLAARKAIENNERTSNCGRRYRLGRQACSQGKNLRAEETEALVWALASRGPGEDTEGRLRKLSELDAQEERLLDLYLEGKLETDRYESRACQLRTTRKTAEDELERIEDRAARRADGERPGSPARLLLADRPRTPRRPGARGAQPRLQDAGPQGDGPRGRQARAQVGSRRGPL
jgi:DNA invertase Pin-like site-specific DNA recombinase